MSRLGIDQLTFGTEAVLDYQAIVTVYSEKEAEMEAFLRSLPDDLSYPQKTQKNVETFAGVEFTGDTPNHILGLAYAKTCAGKGIALSPSSARVRATIQKKKRWPMLLPLVYAYTRKIRTLLLNLCPIANSFQSAPQVSWEDYDQLLRYQILTHPDLTQIFQVNEELANRIKDAVRSASSVEDLVEKVATKRYTKARVRRILTTSW